MKARLILAIFDFLLVETALVVTGLWGLPKIGIHLPLAGLIALMIVWGTYDVFTYRLGSRALRRKQVAGLPDMAGSQGRVVSQLAPEGLVKIKGELWVAKSASGAMEPGTEIVVVGQDRLKLVVRAAGTSGDLERAR